MCLLLCFFFLPLFWGRAGMDGVIKGNVALDAFFSCLLCLNQEEPCCYCLTRLCSSFVSWQFTMCFNVIQILWIKFEKRCFRLNFISSHEAPAVCTFRHKLQSLTGSWQLCGQQWRYIWLPAATVRLGSNMQDSSSVGITRCWSIANITY